MAVAGQMKTRQLCYTRRVCFLKSQRGVLMRIPNDKVAVATNAVRVGRWGLLFTLFFAAQLGIAATACAQSAAAKRTVIRPGHVLDVRTGELRTNQAIVIEGEKITQVGPASE